MADDNVIGIVEKLIDTCRDGEKGYREAAEHTSDPELRGYFSDQCTERAKFAEELQQALHRIGKWETTRQGSVGGVLRRAWIDVKSMVGGGDHSVLEAVEAGEDSAKHAYEEARRESLPPDIRSIVERQATSVIAAHDHVRLLRDRRKAA
jgi:uncharacterized protein (TIGR02284 family)